MPQNVMMVLAGSKVTFFSLPTTKVWKNHLRKSLSHVFCMLKNNDPQWNLTIVHTICRVVNGRQIWRHVVSCHWPISSFHRCNIIVNPIVIKLWFDCNKDKIKLTKVLLYQYHQHWYSYCHADSFNCTHKKDTVWMLTTNIQYSVSWNNLIGWLCQQNMQHIKHNTMQ